MDMDTKNRDELVYQTIKNDILTLQLKPGQIISETEICERFQVSRTPVRNALKMLQNQEFLLNIPYKGFYIPLLNLNNIKQMIYMRIAVETMVIDDFIKIKTPLIMEDIQHQIRRQEAMVQDENFSKDQFYHADANLHSIWFSSTGKDYLWDVLQSEQLHYTRFRKLDFESETNFPRIIVEHHEIFNLIQEGDITSLNKCMKSHLSYSMTRMQDIINIDYKDYFEENNTPDKFKI